MNYEDFKIGESYDVEGEAEKVICKNDDYKVVTTVNSGNFSTSWDEDELKQFKTLPKQLPKEGLLVGKNGDMAYRTGLTSGYGFQFGNYQNIDGWSFVQEVEWWKPATLEQKEQFIEMIARECDNRGLFEDTELNNDALKSKNSGVESNKRGMFPVVKAEKVISNVNGIIFYKGKFAKPLKETATTPQVGKQYNHKKGNTYTVIGFTNNCTEKEDKQFPLTVIYMDHEGRHWSRPLSDWNRSFTLNK